MLVAKSHLYDYPASDQNFQNVDHHYRLLRQKPTYCTVRHNTYFPIFYNTLKQPVDLHSEPLAQYGNLPKGWRVLSDGKRYLFKGGSSGAVNTGMEPYSEFYAYQIANAMGLNAVPYQLGMWKGMLSSYSDCFIRFMRLKFKINQLP